MEDKNYYMPGKIGFFNSLYPEAAKANGVSFEDMVELSGEDYLSFTNPPDGKYLVFDESGPRLEDIPPPDYAVIAQQTLNTLLSEVQTKTYTLNAKLNMGRQLTAAEKDLFNAWLDYSDSLEAVDLSSAPDIEWPEKPNQA